MSTAATTPTTAGSSSHVARRVWQACAVAAAAVIGFIIVAYAMAGSHSASHHGTAPAVARIVPAPVGADAFAVRQQDCRPVGHIVTC